MKVAIPSPLYSYTSHRRQVDAAGDTVRDVLADLDRQFPGIRFRMINEQDQIRQHIRIFINGQLCTDLGAPLNERDTVQIITSISGGQV
jgi:molybdopterin converting factor small subunit